jgi:hypothetical protein
MPYKRTSKSRRKVSKKRSRRNSRKRGGVTDYQLSSPSLQSLPEPVIISNVPPTVYNNIPGSIATTFSNIESSNSVPSSCHLCKSMKDMGLDKNMKSVLCNKCSLFVDTIPEKLKKKLDTQLIDTISNHDIIKGVIESIALDIMTNNTYRCYTTFRGMRNDINIYLAAKYITKLQADYMMAIINIQENEFFTRLNQIINNMEYSSLNEPLTKIQTVTNFIGAINSITSILETLSNNYMSFAGIKTKSAQLPTENKLSDVAILNMMKDTILKEYNKISTVPGNINDFKSILYDIQMKNLLPQFSFDASEFIGVLVKAGVENVDIQTVEKKKRFGLF